MSRGFAPLYILISLAILTTALGAYLVQQSTPKPKIAINSFDDCIKAGNPVMESYPRQCRTQDSKSFIEQPSIPTNNTSITSSSEFIIPVSTCESCPKYSPPPSDFCKNGKIVPGVKDSCSCQMPPICQTGETI